MTPISAKLDRLIDRFILISGRGPDYIRMSKAAHRLWQWEPVPSACGQNTYLYGDARTHYAGIPVEKIEGHRGPQFLEVGFRRGT